MRRESYDSGTHWEALAGYSRAVRVGDRIIVSGTTATGPEGLVGGDDPAAQANFAIDKIENAIERLGGSLKDVIQTRVYVKDIAHWDAIARVHGARFAAIRAANVMVQANLVGDEYLVEIEAEAVVGAGDALSIRVNNDLTLPEYVALAQAAEAAGFDQFWVSNDLFLRSAPVILAAIGSATTMIEIGSCVLNPYTINPAELAMLAATLDELTGCRFNLGLAAGAQDFLRWVGLEHGKPLAAMRESVAAIRGLLAGERPSLEGHFLRWQDDAYLRFDAPRVTPIYIGALGPNMLRLAGEIADGVLPLLFPPEHYFDVKRLIDEGTARRAAGLGELDFAACIWVSLAEDAAAARRVLAEKVAYYGPHLSPLILQRLGLTDADFAAIKQMVVSENDLEKATGMVTEQMLAIGVVGQPEDLMARLKPLVAAGVRHLSFGPPLGPEPLAAIKLMGEHVLPHFEES